MWVHAYSAALYSGRGKGPPTLWSALPIGASNTQQLPRPRALAPRLDPLAPKWCHSGGKLASPPTSHQHPASPSSFYCARLLRAPLVSTVFRIVAGDAMQRAHGSPQLLHTDYRLSNRALTVLYSPTETYRTRTPLYKPHRLAHPLPPTATTPPPSPSCEHAICRLQALSPPPTPNPSKTLHPSLSPPAHITCAVAEATPRERAMATRNVNTCS